MTINDKIIKLKKLENKLNYLKEDAKIVSSNIDQADLQPILLDIFEVLFVIKSVRLENAEMNSNGTILLGGTKHKVNHILRYRDFIKSCIIIIKQNIDIINNSNVNDNQLLIEKTDLLKKDLSEFEARYQLINISMDEFNKSMGKDVVVEDGICIFTDIDTCVKNVLNEQEVI